jgi:tetratricopeptide (TPR) repeat protein
LDWVLNNNLREKAQYAVAIREAFPDVSSSYIFTGETFVELRDWKHAIAEYEQARLLFPENPDSWQRLGELYEWTGDTRRAQECFSRAKHFAKLARDNAKLAREIEAKKSESSSVKGTRAGDPATNTPVGASVSSVNGADCHIIKYKAGWKEGDLINTRTGPGANYSVANKIAVGEKGLVMEFWSTPNGTTPWVKVYRWNSEKKDSATFIGWVNKNFLQFNNVKSRRTQRPTDAQ